MARERRKVAYFWMMGTCFTLIVLSWTWVRTWSVPLALAMSAVAAVIPPFAAIVANSGIISGKRRLDFEDRDDPA